VRGLGHRHCTWTGRQKDRQVEGSAEQCTICTRWKYCRGEEPELSFFHFTQIIYLVIFSRILDLRLDTVVFFCLFTVLNSCAGTGIVVHGNLSLFLFFIDIGMQFLRSGDISGCSMSSFISILQFLSELQ
jgi:hypothetical protein